MFPLKTKFLAILVGVAAIVSWSPVFDYLFPKAYYPGYDESMVRGFFFNFCFLLLAVPEFLDT